MARVRLLLRFVPLVLLAVVAYACAGGQSPVNPAAVGIAVGDGDGSPVQSSVPSNSTFVSFNGRIESVSPPNMRVSGRNVAINNATIITRSQRTIAAGALQVGEDVNVQGWLTGNDTVGGSNLSPSILARSITVLGKNDTVGAATQ
jgi:Domain of unknown function (DUF5666)